MSLAEVARLLDVAPKWVLNTCAALGIPRRYSLKLARRLAVTCAIHEGLGIELAQAFRMAEQGLRAYRGGTAPVTIATGSDVALQIDIARILSTFNIRRSALATSFEPRQRGRRAKRRGPLEAATDWGLDLTLLADNRRKTPEQRVRQLDAMAAFARDVRRVGA